MKHIKKTFQYGEHTITMETGAVARQATSAVFIKMGDTMVLVTVVAKKEPMGSDFFPLTVNYQERFYATGKLPGGFMKREGRPSTQETLTSRLIDRPIRPLFPDEFKNEVQIVATVMSLDPQINADIPAMLGASAALAISGIPFKGPIGAARVGYINGDFVLNPTAEQLKSSQLDLVVAGTQKAVLMVESEAKELPKETMLKAVMFGHQHMQTAITAIIEFANEVGTPSWNWQAPPINEALHNEIKTFAKPLLVNALQIKEKQARYAAFDDIYTKALEKFCPENSTDVSHLEITNVIADVKKCLMREQVLATKIRIDGRDTKTVRPIYIDLGKLPRVHGSANFTRGETQAIVVTTLGTDSDAQIIDIPAGEYSERFMLHYNFPPYCTGETGQMGSPKRREIGHGNLARRALAAVIPDEKTFPYVIRVVSEITESNGSSSMASVCGGCLSLMDAGVPIKSAVAGIAMGLIKEEHGFVVLTDILGDEDHLGDMDFKVAGTHNGITALQMDIKIEGITEEIMNIALNQAEEGRKHILGLMHEAIPAPRDHVSDYAPRIITHKINPEKIREVIGKGGAVIRAIIEETKVTNIDISDQGVVTIAAVEKGAGQAALDRIKALTEEPEVNKIYTGKVAKIMDFGAFVTILPNVDGLVHISQIANKRVANVSEYLTEGQVVKVKVLEIDKQGKIRLSMKDVEGNNA